MMFHHTRKTTADMPRKRSTDKRFTGKGHRQNLPSPETLDRLFRVITLTEQGATWPEGWLGKPKKEPNRTWFQTASGDLVQDFGEDTIRGTMVREWVEKKRSPRA